MKEIILIGGGGHCTSCIDVIEKHGEFKIKGILDLPEKKGKMILGYEIIGCDNDIPSIAGKNTVFLITLGQIKTALKRKGLFEILKSHRLETPTIVSPRAYVSAHSRIGEGTIVMHDAIINANSVVGKNCIINSRSLIEHDNIVGNHCHIATGSILNGNVEIGDESFIGSGSVVVNDSIVPPQSFVKANSLVYK